MNKVLTGAIFVFGLVLVMSLIVAEQNGISKNENTNKLQMKFSQKYLTVEEFAEIIRRLTMFNIDNDLAKKVNLINQMVEYVETLDYE